MILAVLLAKLIKDRLKSLCTSEHEKSRVPPSFDILDRGKLWLFLLKIIEGLPTLRASVDIDSQVPDLESKLEVKRGIRVRIKPCLMYQKSPFFAFSHEETGYKHQIILSQAPHSLGLLSFE